MKNISKSFYKKTTGNNYVLKDFSLSIKKQAITALVGGNGAGKTSVLNLISRFTEPDKSNKSEIIYNGKTNLLKYPAYKIPRLGIGRLFQDAHIFPDLTILENMLIADFNRFGENPFETILFGKKIKKKEVEKTENIIAIFNTLFGDNNSFVKDLNVFAGNLSYGQQRLLGLARLLVGNYKLILLDEPTSGINSELFNKISNIIKLMKQQGKTIFIIEHNMTFIKNTADIVAFLSDGKIYKEGKPEDVLNDDYIIKNYLGMI